MSTSKTHIKSSLRYLAVFVLLMQVSIAFSQLSGDRLVRQILEKPYEFQQVQVTVTGYVTSLRETRTPGVTMYYIKDLSSQAIMVRTQKSAPVKGEIYTVEGTVYINSSETPLIHESSRVADNPELQANEGGNDTPWWIYAFLGIAIIIVGMLGFFLKQQSVSGGDFLLREIHDSARESLPEPEYILENDTARIHLPPAGTLKFLPGRFVVVSGLDDITEIVFYLSRGRSTAEYTFGRASGRPYHHIQLKSPTVSSKQAKLVYQNSAYALVNLGAEEGTATLVNGRELGQGEYARLRNGDLITMGEVVFQLQEMPEEEQQKRLKRDGHKRTDNKSRDARQQVAASSETMVAISTNPELQEPEHNEPLIIEEIPSPVIRPSRLGVGEPVFDNGDRTMKLSVAEFASLSAEQTDFTMKFTPAEFEGIDSAGHTLKMSASDFADFNAGFGDQTMKFSPVAFEGVDSVGHTIKISAADFARLHDGFEQQTMKFTPAEFGQFEEVGHTMKLTAADFERLSGDLAAGQAGGFAPVNFSSSMPDATMKLTAADFERISNESSADQTEKFTPADYASSVPDPTMKLTPADFERLANDHATDNNTPISDEESIETSWFIPGADNATKDDIVSNDSFGKLGVTMKFSREDFEKGWGNAAVTTKEKAAVLAEMIVDKSDIQRNDLPGYFEVVSGETVVSNIRFTEDHSGGLNSFSFGKGDGVPYKHVELHSAKANERQAKMVYRNQTYTLVNLVSDEHQATKVNDRIMALAEFIALKEGDVIQMGDVVFRYVSEQGEA